MNQGSTTIDFQEEMTVIEAAYLGRVNKELEQRVEDALARIAAEGEPGIKALVQRLYRGFEIVDSRLQFQYWGDPELGHNEWLKKVMIINALGRAHARSAMGELEALLNANSGIAQFYDLLQPAVVWALAEIGDRRAVPSLRAALRRSDIYERTRVAIRAALGKLEGEPANKPEGNPARKWWQVWN
jgi:hypothetical protein